MPIFVRTRHIYDSYSDYYKLIELAQFPTCYTEEIDWNSDNTYICSYFNFPKNDNGFDPFPEHTCRMIFWDLERYEEGKVIDERFDEHWVSDRWYAEKLVGSTYVTLGTDGLCPDIELSKRFDFAHMAYMTHRREHIVNWFKDNGMKIAPNAWGEDRHKAILQSKAMLCTHQDEMPMMEPLRYALAVSYELPILAEYCEDFYPFEKGMEMILPGDYRLYWLNYPKENYQFKPLVLQALGEHED